MFVKETNYLFDKRAKDYNELYFRIFYPRENDDAVVDKVLCRILAKHLRWLIRKVNALVKSVLCLSIHNRNCLSFKSAECAVANSVSAKI